MLPFQIMVAFLSRCVRYHAVSFSLSRHQYWYLRFSLSWQLICEDLHNFLGILSFG
jgi:hypothetical protein